MEWKDVANVVGKAAPILGTLLGGPAGAAVGALVASALGTGNSPDEVSQALVSNPEAAVKLKEIESKRQVDLQTILMQSEGNRLANDTATVQAVNATMQAEAAAEHWPTYSWRPALGFAVAFSIFASSVTVIGAYGSAMINGLTKPLEYLPGMLAAMAGIVAVASPILGIASWFRGKMQADPIIPTDNKG